jgi:uncharacterized protein YbjT (DUF2867 family)
MSSEIRPTRTAWIAGANGLTGRALVEVLLGAPDHGRIVAITRRPLGRDHGRLANRIVPLFGELGARLASQRCDDAFCCLGTTIARAGSEAAFRAVDLDEVLRFATVARDAGAARLVVMSAVGADPASKNFYRRVKGEMEAAISQLKIPAIDILQPGLLLGGSRAEARPAEAVARLAMPLLNPLLRGSLADYRGIAAGTVAKAMLGIARSGRKGVTRYRYPALARAAKQVQGA